MHSLVVALLVPLQLAPPQPTPLLHRPWTIEDALFVLPEVTGRVVRGGDFDGDGRADLVAVCGSGRNARDGYDRLVVFSGLDGTPLSTLMHEVPVSESWSCEEGFCRIYRWDVGGDVDADGTPDLIVGLPRQEAAPHAGRHGRVRITSGRDGRTLLQLDGDAPLDGLGESVLFLGDVDGDGHDDYVIGATQTAWEVPVVDFKEVKLRSTGVWGGDPANSVRTLTLPDGRTMEMQDYVDGELATRTAETGFVSVRSGRSGEQLYCVHGERPGYGFGWRTWAVGDLDGDGATDFGVASIPRSNAPTILLSGRDGTLLGETQWPGRVGPAGDVDGDGRADYLLDRLDDRWQRHYGKVRAYSGADGSVIGDFRSPEPFSKRMVAMTLGDVDGDGHDDVIVGEGDYHVSEYSLLEQNHGSFDDLSLAEALTLESYGRYSGYWESGVALVYSGRTKRVLCGIWGEPFSTQGVGLEVVAVDDVTGDGLPEIGVAAGRGLYVFAGPGRSKDGPR